MNLKQTFYGNKIQNLHFGVVLGAVEQDTVQSIRAVTSAKFILK